MMPAYIIIRMMALRWGTDVFQSLTFLGREDSRSLPVAADSTSFLTERFTTTKNCGEIFCLRIDLKRILIQKFSSLHISDGVCVPWIVCEECLLSQSGIKKNAFFLWRVIDLADRKSTRLNS